MLICSWFPHSLQHCLLANFTPVNKLFTFKIGPMKKLIMLFSAAAICSSAHAQNPIPNPGFEIWGTTTSASIPVPVNWDNLDSITHAVGLSCVQGAPAPYGAYYLKLVSFSTGAAVVPGIAVSGKMYDISPYAPIYGFPLTSRPAYLTGQWQYAPSGSDRGFISVFLSKWNTATSVRDTVGFVKYNLSGSVTTWTAFSIPIVYYRGSSPDSAIITLSSSVSGTGSGAAAGSYLYLDTLNFSGAVPTGTVTLSSNAVEKEQAPAVSVFPNPGNSIVNISVHNDAPAAVNIAVYDLNGRRVKDLDTHAGEGDENIAVDISALPGGVYFVKVTEEQFTEVRKLLIER